ncbi:MAG: small subunit ribosomal protein S4 [Parcubacteria group bacterium Gr01-1014_72]|nr:MAG: small subunit ribosomal protein S4 [Parcubacteria group bacterium Gr01-1014_72]
MRIGPRYRIARRLGADVFEKTQGQKFAMRRERRGRENSRPRSEFGLQLLEKQRARYTYGIGERQFKRYVKNIIAQRGRSDTKLFQKLETRLDNVLYRLGLAPTRRAARQMASHGHLLVNGVRTRIPSHELSKGDRVSVRVGSRDAALFVQLKERLAEHQIPPWLSLDPEKREGVVLALPPLERRTLTFDISAILEFYKR